MLGSAFYSFKARRLELLFLRPIFFSPSTEEVGGRPRRGGGRGEAGEGHQGASDRRRLYSRCTGPPQVTAVGRGKHIHVSALSCVKCRIVVELFYISVSRIPI